MSNVDFGSSLEGYLTEGPGPSDYIQVIVTLEGVTPETGCSVQARTSYLPSEILWGQRFEHSTVKYDQKEAKYAVSYTTINAFQQDNTPRCSAKELDERREKEA